MFLQTDSKILRFRLPPHSIAPYQALSLFHKIPADLPVSNQTKQPLPSKSSLPTHTSDTKVDLFHTGLVQDWSDPPIHIYPIRSEERRVGKECRCRWWLYR